MTSSVPLLIEETNLSHAWGRVFLYLFDNRCKEISPLVITLTGFKNGIPDEDEAIVNALNECLLLRNKKTVSKVSETNGTKKSHKLCKISTIAFQAI